MIYTDFKAPLKAAVDKAVQFLAMNCDERGQLCVLRSMDRNLVLDCANDDTFFGTSIFIACTRDIHHPLLNPIYEIAYQSLIKDMILPGVWTFWTPQRMRQAPEYAVVPDLDTTVMASLVLRPHHSLIAMGLNIPIMLNNRNEQGLFKTWLRAGSDPDLNDTDSVVNSSILWFLGENDHTRAVCNYLNEIVLNHIEHDTHWTYVGQAILYYGMSRCWASGAKSLDASRDTVLDRLTQMQRNKCMFVNAVEVAYSASAKLNYEDETNLEEIISALVDMQNADGSWSAAPVWVWPSPPHLPASLWWGSNSITTSYVVEALAKFYATQYRQPLQF